MEQRILRYCIQRDCLCDVPTGMWRSPRALARRLNAVGAYHKILNDGGNMKEKFICYDGVDGDITYHDTEEEALQTLKEYIESGLEDGEWMDGVSNSFVAKVTHEIKEREIEALEEYRREGISKFVEMDITEKCANCI
jgi:hypothetical protein